MRISTTSLILICSVLFFGAVSDVLAQVPKFTVINLQHTCGPSNPATGSFVVHITDGDPSQSGLSVQVQSGATLFPPIVISPIPATFPAVPIDVTVTGLTGQAGGGAKSYLVVVADDDNTSIADNGPNFSIFNFFASTGTITNNTSGDCTAPNGAITVTLSGNTGVAARPITYSWSGPAGFVDPGTKDISGLRGGDYTLTYKDSNTPATQCTLGPIHINDPAPPDYNDLTNGSACSGDALGFNLATLKKPASVTASSFQLVSTSFAGLTPGPGLPAPDGSTIAAGDLADDVWINTDNVTHDVVYTITTFACSTPGNTITVKFTINPQPAYSNYANTTPGICSGQPIGVTLDPLKLNLTADSYTVTNVVSTGLTPAGGVSAAVVPYAVANADLADDKWKNVQTGPRDVTYTIVPRIGSCDGNPFDVRVTINPEPFAPNGAKTICSDDVVAFDLSNHLATLGNNVTGTTFTWIATDNTNVTGESLTMQSTSTIGDALTNVTTTNQAVQYTVTPTAATCAGASFLVVVTVAPEPFAPNATKTTCSKDNVGFNLSTHLATLGNNVAGTTFSWTAADNTNVSGESLSAQATASIGDVLVNTTATSQPVQYTVVPTSGAGCVGAPFIVTVTVDPEPVAPNVPKTICSGDNVNVNLQTDAINLGNAIPSVTFEWSVVADNPGVTGEATGLQTTSTIGDVLVNTTAINQTVDYTVTPTTAAGCEGNPFTVTVTINPRPDYNNYNNDLVAGGICATPLAINLDNQKKTTSVLATAYDVTVTQSAGLTAAGGSPALTTLTDRTANEIADDVWSNVTAAPIDVVYTVVPKNGTCAGNSFDVRVTIKPQPDYVPTPVTQCSNVAIGFNLNTAKKVTSVTATLFDIVAINPDPSLTAAGGSPIVASGVSATEIADDVWKNLTAGPLDVTYTVAPRAGTCTGAQFVVTVTINPEPLYITNILPDICSGTAIGFDLDDQKAPTGVAATTFDFTTSAGALTPMGTTTATGTGNNMVIADDQWRNVTNLPIDLTYTITPKSASSCAGAPFTITVKVNPQPDYNDLSVPTGFCSSPLGIDITTLKKSTSIAATSFVVAASPDPGINQVAGMASLQDISDDVWVNFTTAPVALRYDIVPKAGCDGDTFTVNVTILPSPVYSNYNNDNAPGGICSDDAIAIDLNSLHDVTSIAATSFTITDNAPAGLTKNSSDPNLISDDVWTNLTASPVDVIYTITPKAGTCDGAQFTVVVTVNPEPVVPDAPGTSCSGGSVNFNLQNVVGGGGNMLTGVTFVWKANADNPNVTGESLTDKTTGTINDVLVNTTSVDQIVQYTVTPTSASGCAGTPFTVTITVVPLPVLAAGQLKENCGGSSASYEIQLNPANMPAGTFFRWNDPDGPLGPATSGDVAAGTPGTTHINDVLINLSAAPLNVTYSVTPYIGTCNGTPQNVVIRVYRPAVVEAGSDQTICIDHGPYQLVGSFRALSATTATWSVVSEPTPGHAVINQPSFTNPSTSTFTATIAGDYILQLESDDPPAPNVCGPAIDIVTITVLDKPVIAPLQTTLVCANDPVDYEIKMNPANTPANTVFNWTAPANPGATDGVDVPLGPPGTFHITDLLRNDGSSNIDVIYNVTPSVGLCVGNPENITVTVKPGPVLALNQTTAICSGDQVNYEILLNPANTPAGTTLSWPDPDGSGPAKSKFNVAADPVGTRHITDTLYNGTGAPLNVVYSVIAKGLNGCNGVVRDVTVVVNPGAVVEAGNPQAVCSNGTVTLVGSSIGGLATQGTWDIILNPSGGDGAITQTDPTDPDGATFKATVAGNYTLRLTTDDPDGPGGCSAASDVVVITVRPVGDPSCTGGSGTCATVSIVPVPTPATCSNSDGSVFFNINPPLPVTGDVKITIDGTGSTVLPSPRTNFASIDGFTFDVLAVGTYSYVIEYGDASCTKTGVFSIDRSGTVGTATVSNLINPTCFSGTGTATIDVPGETGNILQWTANGIDFHNFVVGNPVSGLPAGLIAINRAGDPCAAGVFINFVVPDDIPLTFVATDASCNGNDGTIEVINYTAGEDPYVFDINGTQTNMPADSVFRGFTADTYTIAVTDNKGCTKTYAPLIIRQIVGPGTLDTLYVHKGISVPDLPSGSALVGVNPSGLEPYETRLELTEPLFASQSFFSDWAEVPVNPLSLKFEQSYTNLFAGVYELGLRDAGGCTKNYVLIIDMDTQLFIPNIFTPNEDGHNDVFYIRNLPTESKLLVTNRWGKEVFKSSSYQNDWNGGDTVDGMYYYTLTLGSQSFSGWVEILRGQ